jgi:hypothetical protein
VLFTSSSSSSSTSPVFLRLIIRVIKGYLDDGYHPVLRAKRKPTTQQQQQQQHQKKKLENIFLYFRK